MTSDDAAVAGATVGRPIDRSPDGRGQPLPASLWSPDPAGVAAPIPELDALEREIVHDRRHEWYLVRAAAVAIVIVFLAVLVRMYGN